MSTLTLMYTSENNDSIEYDMPKDIAMSCGVIKNAVEDMDLQEGEFVPIQTPPSHLNLVKEWVSHYIEQFDDEDQNGDKIKLDEDFDKSFMAKLGVKYNPDPTDDEVDIRDFIQTCHYLEQNQLYKFLCNQILQMLRGKEIEEVYEMSGFSSEHYVESADSEPKKLENGLYEYPIPKAEVDEMLITETYQEFEARLKKEKEEEKESQ